jgi:UDP-N-acetylglucosamine 2-epimerase (non-hydrolysing)
LSGVSGVHLIEPLEYVPFVDLMRRADLILTDSGGVQEEAPALGKPVLVLRSSTERQEAVEAGTAVLTGTDPEIVVREVSRLLDSEPARRAMTAVHNPFGDGHACLRIAEATLSFFERNDPSRRPSPAPLAGLFAPEAACEEVL